MIFLLFFIFLTVQSAATQDTLPEFPVHFVVIDGSEEVAAVATLEQMHREIEILNTYFVTEDKRPLVRFRFKSAAFFDDIENTACSFVDSANEGMYIGRWANLYKECADTKLRDPRAVNFVIFDSYTDAQGWRSRRSRGATYGGVPVVFIDYQALGHKGSLEEHEMGHAFGLGHICDSTLTEDGGQNIMHHNGECPDQKKYRAKYYTGFNAEQEAIIRRTILRHRKKLGLDK